MRYGLSVYGVGTEFFAPKENTQVVIKNGKIHVNIPESADLATVIPRPAKNKVSGAYDLPILFKQVII
jgi:hypothetical protein